MDSARPGNPKRLLTLRQAAQKLAVSVDVLIEWNEQQILKPASTQDGIISYGEEQLDQFIKTHQSLLPPVPNPETFTNSSQIKPGRAEFEVKEKQKFIKWVGGELYSEDFVKNY